MTAKFKTTATFKETRQYFCGIYRSGRSWVKEVHSRVGSLRPVTPTLNPSPQGGGKVSTEGLKTYLPLAGRLAKISEARAEPVGVTP